MCYDLLDPNNPGRTNAAYTFAPGFGFPPATALTDPDGTTSSLVSEVVVSPPAKPQIVIEQLPDQQLTITDWNYHLQPLNLPPLEQVVPFHFSTTAKPLPCVQHWPANVDHQALSDMMLVAGANLAGKLLATGNEWGVYITRLPSGGLFLNPMFTAPNSNPTNLNGAHAFYSGVVVAFLHAHPYSSTEPQQTPSSTDQGSNSDESRFLTMTRPGGIADPNMLAGIVTPVNGNYLAPIVVYVYDKNNWHNPDVGCQVESASQ